METMAKNLEEEWKKRNKDREKDFSEEGLSVVFPGLSEEEVIVLFGCLPPKADFPLMVVGENIVRWIEFPSCRIVDCKTRDDEGLSYYHRKYLDRKQAYDAFYRYYATISEKKNCSGTFLYPNYYKNEESYRHKFFRERPISSCEYAVWCILSMSGKEEVDEVLKRDFFLGAPELLAKVYRDAVESHRSEYAKWKELFWFFAKLLELLCTETEGIFEEMPL